MPMIETLGAFAEIAVMIVRLERIQSSGLAVFPYTVEEKHLSYGRKRFHSPFFCSGMLKSSPA